MRKTIVFSVALLLVGCAANQLERVATIEPEETILVASKFDNNFSLQTTGTTAFQNARSDIDVGDWEVTKYIESEVLAALQPAYDVVVNAAFRDLVSMPPDNYMTGYPGPIQSEAALKLAREVGARYILLVSPVEFQDVYFGTNQFIKGYGLYQRSFLARSETIHYVQLSMNLFDAQTGAFLATNGTVGHQGGDSVWITHEDIHELPEGDLETIDLDLEALRQSNERLLKTLIDRSLQFMTFTVAETQ